MTTEALSFQWDAVEGPTSLVPDVKFPRRAIRSFQPSTRDRILSWSGKCVSPFLLPDLLQTLCPSLVVGLTTGASVARRMAGLNGACLVPAGTGVELALDSPRYGLSIAALAARYYRFCKGSVDIVLADTSAGSFTDRVSLQVPIIGDNHTAGQESLTCVKLDQVSGYSRYSVKDCCGGYIMPQLRGEACPFNGAVETSGFVPVYQTGDMGNDLLMGYSVKVPSANGYPLFGVSQSFHAGTAEVYRAAVLSFW